ncbi:transglycosylase SLT domain-containing protein [Methylomonas sp. AM2-LC]|uniref:transglycosylase SLT domain-containing protein n=1 Tax=Methylomonas sp. AM2-LC TaxID=3153301 RepID=UPI003263F826
MKITDFKTRVSFSTDCFFETEISVTATAKIKKATTVTMILYPLLFCQTSLAVDKVGELITSAANIHKQAATFPQKLENTLWGHVAKQNHIDPYTLYAVALIESAKNSDPNHVTPWPWALNKAGQSIIPVSQQEAHTLLNKSIAQGNRHIDIGLMQINLHWHGHRVAKPEHLLNPAINLQIGAGLLAEAIQSSPNNLVLGIGRYHNWQNIQTAVVYGRRVLAVADKIRTVL